MSDLTSVPNWITTLIGTGVGFTLTFGSTALRDGYRNRARLSHKLFATEVDWIHHIDRVAKDAAETLLVTVIGTLQNRSWLDDAVVDAHLDTPRGPEAAMVWYGRRFTGINVSAHSLAELRIRFFLSAQDHGGSGLWEDPASAIWVCSVITMRGNRIPISTSNARIAFSEGDRLPWLQGSRTR